MLGIRCRVEIGTAGAVVVAQPPANETDDARGGDATASAATAHLRVDIGSVLQVLLPALRQLLGVPSITAAPTPAYGTFRLNFRRFDRFELDLRWHTHPYYRALPCPICA